MFIDILDGGPAPKRGDLLQSNVGNRRERTWLILRATRLRQRQNSRFPRYKLFMARWWELEADMRIRLFRSAERNGGQRVIYFKRYPAKKKRTFEQHISRPKSSEIFTLAVCRFPHLET